MIGPIGQLAMLVALALSAMGAVAAFVGARTGRSPLVASARNASFAILLLVAMGFGMMEYALITHDFSVKYVAQVGSLETPTFYTVISLWSALEGSILLWALILAGYTALLAWRTARSRETPMLDAYTLGTILCVNVFFLLLIVGPADPFGTLNPAPANGPGPNPLLQNHPFMGVHPPLLYIGYVGMAVPFALGIGALLSGNTGREWSKAVRRWTLVPWAFLTLGITAGAWWSYEVLGWGGFWAWDPVENASFMPWLTATAFLHSVMVQERRDMLKTWTLSLIVSTFLLTLLGTFLTRSGVIASVHAFSEGLIGPFFLGFLGLVLITSLALIAWKSDYLRGAGSMDSVVSRETAFLVNNLLFVAFTFVVLLGTMFPLIAEALRGAKVTVGGPYFSRMAAPIALALVFLTGVGPALPWRRGSTDAVRRKFLWPGAVAVLGGAILLIGGMRSLSVWLTMVLAIFAAGLVVGEFIGPARARRSAHHESWPAAILRVATGNRRRYGGYVVHFGVMIAAVGIAVASVYKHEAEWTLSKDGPAQTYGPYELKLDSVWAVQDPNRDGVIAGVTAHKSGRLIKRLAFGGSFPWVHRKAGLIPRLNYYPTMNEPIATPSVYEHPGEDLYLVLVAYERDGSKATIKAIVSPMVGWIWLGGIVIAAGVAFALWPRRRRSDAEGDETGTATQEDLVESAARA
ncbi:MAG: heme lyase CcmF/NrfE family subunit [Gemmatimonadetes bacterium]|nr:heme lyase CcmF/NrfE family subunit [Gemmatimonadota bacterium]